MKVEDINMTYILCYIVFFMRCCYIFYKFYVKSRLYMKQVKFIPLYSPLVKNYFYTEDRGRTFVVNVSSTELQGIILQKMVTSLLT
jgi:hypothetical protein